MPKRTDLKKILLIGSGPIVIGQACEFDYSGTQALKALKEEGFKVILVNSNPATIMTDPELSDRVYVEPLTVEAVSQVIEIERPDAILPTMGGQTALNLAMALHKEGVLKKYGVEMLGARPDAIERAENRDAFKQTMDSIGVESAKSRICTDPDQTESLIEELGLPLILRPSFTMGGEGGGSAHTAEELRRMLTRALFLSPTRQVLVEENLTGWKEYELEVVRDHRDNVVIVCSIENFDPMGVHTGDSITVAPAQTLTDREYQNLRNQAIRIIRAIGVETGGSNIQFSVNPKDGRVVCIEMNPRVSRSSALASKATGFPIARVAAKLAIGYTLDELRNDITGTTPCSFEPSIDYVVTKVPRFDFEKFRPTPSILSTQMKSVGEVMAIGHTFEESLGKALAGLETSVRWLEPLSTPPVTDWERISTPTPSRIRAVADGIRAGADLLEISKKSGIDPWFLERMRSHLELESKLEHSPRPLPTPLLLLAKRRGWTDQAIARVLKLPNDRDVAQWRTDANIHAAFHCVDTCAAEFEAKTPYFYSSYFGENESTPGAREKVMVLGGGPNRIGQGIEFDYCCVHASQAIRSMGFETIMVNSNPETVSTDFDISDRLFFEPLTAEHVMGIVRNQKPKGVLVQFGGQTPLKLARELEKRGLKVLGTSTDSIDLAEDRKRCDEIVRSLRPLGLEQPPSTIAHTREEALTCARSIGYPLLLRPSYVLGGRGMRVITSESHLLECIDEAIEISDTHPVLIDRFLENATEVDVDALSDGHDTIIGGVMEHIEQAGIHSGDSACVLPTVTISKPVLDRIRKYTVELARQFKVIGLMNLQFAIQGDRVFLLEVNPRASRTVPFVSKATGYPLARLATQVILGRTLKDLGLTRDLDLSLEFFAAKVPVFPFHKFPGADVLLGPEMKSTGEVMGRDRSFASAYAKALIAAGVDLPRSGKAFLSVRNEDKQDAISLARDLTALGFELWATSGTANHLVSHDIPAQTISKLKEGTPNCVDAIQGGMFSLVINTTSEPKAIHDSFLLRRAALERKVPYTTVMTTAAAMVSAIREIKKGPLRVVPL